MNATLTTLCIHMHMCSYSHRIFVSNHCFQIGKSRTFPTTCHFLDSLILFITKIYTEAFFYKWKIISSQNFSERLYTVYYHIILNRPFANNLNNVILITVLCIAFHFKESSFVILLTFVGKKENFIMNAYFHKIQSIRDEVSSSKLFY